MSNIRLHESGALVESKATNGVFPVRIITEGKGSTAVYTASVLKEYASAFNNAPSFMNHPLDLSKPHLRDVTSIAGRIVSEVKYEEKEGVAGLYAELKVDPRWQSFVEEYKDVIGLSVYIEGESKEIDGQVFCESFNGDDPYKSVDFVVAAGRGGRIERAMESYRSIESSVGTPNGTSTEASVQEKEKEKMDDKETQEFIKNSIAEALTPVLDFISKSQLAEQEEIQGTADAEAVETVVAERLAAFDEKNKLIEAANLLPSQAESIRAAALRGEDVAPLIEAAKKVLAEAKAVKPVAGETIRIGENVTADKGFVMSGARFN